MFKELTEFFHPTLEENKQKYWTKSNSAAVKKFVSKVGDGTLKEEDYQRLQTSLRNKLSTMKTKKNKNADKMSESIDKFETFVIENIFPDPDESGESSEPEESDSDSDGSVGADEEDLEEALKKTKKRKKKVSYEENKKNKKRKTNPDKKSKKFIDPESVQGSSKEDDKNDGGKEGEEVEDMDESLIKKVKKVSGKKSESGFTKKGGLVKVNKRVNEATIDLFEDEMTEGIVKPDNVIKVPINSYKSWKICPTKNGKKSQLNLNQVWNIRGKKPSETNIAITAPELPKVIKTLICTSSFFLGKLSTNVDELQKLYKSPRNVKQQLVETMEFLGLEGLVSEDLFSTMMNFINKYIQNSKTSLVEVVEEPDVGLAEHHFNISNYWKEEDLRKKVEEEKKIKMIQQKEKEKEEKEGMGGEVGGE